MELVDFEEDEEEEEEEVIEEKNIYKEFSEYLHHAME